MSRARSPGVSVTAQNDRAQGLTVGHQHLTAAEVWPFWDFCGVCPSDGFAPAREAFAWVALNLLQRRGFAPALRLCCVTRLCSLKQGSGKCK